MLYKINSQVSDYIGNNQTTIKLIKCSNWAIYQKDKHQALDVIEGVFILNLREQTKPIQYGMELEGITNT